MMDSVLAAQPASLAGHFTWIDWLVVVGYLVFTTILGSVMAGKQATIRDFFLGGRKLPWYAVCGSNIATEISAVTFVGVPAIVFASRGNFTYLQLQLIGLVVARFVVAYVFVPAYYDREIYSPYDYMADRLGGAARTVTTCLFILGGALAQGARVYLTALILDLIVGRALYGGLAEATGISTLTWSIYTFGLISVVWCWIGGITTVIWTDVILFLVFMIGAFVALGAAVVRLPGGWSELFSVGWHARQAGSWGKFTVFDFAPSLVTPYTFWAGLIAYTWHGLFAFGTDQVMCQRIFCCKGPRPARWAVIGSNVGQIVTVAMLLVGVGLYAFYQRFPLTGEALGLVRKNGDYVFPLFIIEELAPGVTGLIIAAIFAAAISTLVSVVASFSQTTLSAFYLPLSRRYRARRGITISDEQAMQNPRLVLMSRMLVVVWGVILCLTAQLAERVGQRDEYRQIINLALSMAGYTGGALLAGFMLAFLRLGIDARGFIWSAPLSVLTVFALAWHQPWSHAVCWAGGGVLLGTWGLHVLQTRRGPVEGGSLFQPVLPVALQTVLLGAGITTMIALSYVGYFGKSVDAQGNVNCLTLAWPWFIPVGSVVAFVFGYLLARRDGPTGASAV
jgi:solute:Na+ symporter, SSS family